jgi:sulfur dioxygenase
MSQVKEMECGDAATQLSSFRVIDVREPNEWVGELGCIAEAELISMGDVPADAAQWTKTQPILLVCRSGKRSRHTGEYLISQGFHDVTNLTGGMIAWNVAELPSSPRN